MSKKTVFVFNRKNFREQVLMGPGTEQMLVSHAESVKPAGDSIVVTADYTSERVQVRIVDDSWRGMFREARDGHLSGAIGMAAGDRKQWYTTKSGKRRLASEAQIRNWSRGKK